MFRFLPIFVCLISFISCSGQVKNLDAKDFLNTMNAEKIKYLIDVRTTDEYSEEHIEESKNMDWNDPNFEIELEKMDRGTPIFFYCLSGGRSGNAMKKAAEMGFRHVYGLNGGLMSWRSEKLPLVNQFKCKKAGMTVVEYESLYKGKDKKILIDFYADWCMPCQKMKPYLKKIETKLATDVTVIRINADKNPELCQALGINGLPYVFIYKNDKLESKRLGFMSEEELLKLINE